MNLIAFVYLILFSYIHVGIHCNSKVWLTVSSIMPKVNGNLKQRVLELNWFNVNVGKDNWIGLFHNKIEKICHKSKALVVLQPTDSEGRYRTDVGYPLKFFTSDDIRKKCLGFYIAYCKSRRVIAKNCIRLHATWMEDTYQHIKNRSIRNLMIPGTHNAASYYDGYKEINFIQSAIDNYAICQDENIFNQLLYGIRYLDLRVMFDGFNFWIAHDVIKMNNKLDDVLQQIREFMDITSKEVVIVDFHRFPKGFSENKQLKHNLLFELLDYYLKPYLSTTDKLYSITIDELVTSGKRVIVGYAEEEIDRKDYLYPAVKHLWPQADQVSTLYLYLKNAVCSNYNPMLAEAAMAEMTPTATKALFNVYGGLRQMADDVNSDVTKWFRDEMSCCANIIATDFFLGNNIIEVSIISNVKRKYQNTSCNYHYQWFHC